MASLSEDFSCPVCNNIFKTPVILSCRHSVCKKCLQQFWKSKNTQECPVCKRRSSKDDPPHNKVIRTQCKLLRKEKKEKRSSGSVEICSLHKEKLQLFCVEDKELVCLVCRDSKQHNKHQVRPIGEAVSSHKEELKTALKSLKEKLNRNEDVKGELEKTVQHIKTQADHTEHQIKHQFDKIHQFLRDEEKATITALREEEEQKQQMMKEKLEEMNTHISALSHTIKDMEEMLKASDAYFLKEFPGSMERVQISQPDPQTPSGALIHVSQYLGNLQYRVWRKMQDVVHYTPVILDPNTAHPRLVMSDDLSTVSYSWDEQPIPDNPERFDIYECVLGSEGFKSGSCSWDVEIRGSECWSLGVTTASNRRKGRDFCNADVWRVTYDPYNQLGAGSSVEQDLERVRVYLDYDSGTVSFSDPIKNRHLHTFTTTFTDTVFPFFCNLDEVNSLRVLPVKL